MLSDKIFDVYIASCDTAGGIYHYKLDKSKLLLKEFTPLDRPMYLAREGSKLYAALRDIGNNSDSGIISYRINEDGTLSDSGDIKTTHGKVTCHLSVVNGTVYTANYISGSVTKLPDTVIQRVGKGVHPTRQTSPHAHYISPSPDGKYILSTDLGLDTVYVYDADLNTVSEAKVPDGHGARHLAFDKAGKTVFCVNELGSSVTVFNYCDGKLTLSKTFDTLNKISENNTSAAIRFKNDMLYISNRGADSISCMKWNGESLKLVSVVDCGGKSPRDFNIFGDCLLCANQHSNNVTMFKIVGERLEKIEDEIQITTPLCII